MKTTINAQIVAHSVNEQGDELISVLATFPRIILAEVNTHRMLSKNTSRPQECINSNCKNILYVSKVELGLPLQCESCINKRIDGN